MTALNAIRASELVERPTRTLLGPALDWAFAQALELPATILGPLYGTGPRVFIAVGTVAIRQQRFQPSSNWGQGGVYIAQFGFEFQHQDGVMEARAPGMYGAGADHLVAMCRAVIANRLGDSIACPVELLA